MCSSAGCPSTSTQRIDLAIDRLSGARGFAHVTGTVTQSALGREVRHAQRLLAKDPEASLDLTTGSRGQAFLVDQVIEKCRGGDPARDVDCTLALLLDQRFTVMDHLPARRSVTETGEDQRRSIVTVVVVIGLGVAAMGGLAYGVATCEFPGCRAVFGVPLVLIGGGALFLLGD
jgi:hypothetical protein